MTKNRFFVFLLSAFESENMFRGGRERTAKVLTWENLLFSGLFFSNHYRQGISQREGEELLQIELKKRKNPFQ